DDRVGQELLAHGAQALLGLGAIRLLQLELDHLAEPHRLHLAEAERGEGAAHRLALRVEDRSLEGHEHAGFHGRAIYSGRGRGATLWPAVTTPMGREPGGRAAAALALCGLGLWLLAVAPLLDPSLQLGER